MTNRTLTYIIKDQRPLVLPAAATVREACRTMYERCVGSALVIDGRGRLAGIFTGRDAVRLLASGKEPGETPLAKAMTRKPVTATPNSRAIDVLRAMCERGFRHVPVIEGGKICGVVSRNDFKGMELEELCWLDRGGATRNAADRQLSEIIRGQQLLLHAPDDSVEIASRSMLKHKSGSVLVVDGQRRLIGIFTGRDAVRLLARARKGVVSRLRSAMTPSPVTLGLASRASDALHAMNDGGFRHLPVLDNGKPIGVVSRRDFTGVEIDRLDEEERLKECIW